MVSQVVGAAVGYLGILVIGRYVEPGAYGSYLLAFSMIGILASLIGLGTGEAHQRHLSTGTDVGRALGVLVRIRAVMTLAVALLAGAAYFIWRTAGGRLADGTTFEVLLIAVGIHLVGILRSVAFETWNAQSRVQRVEGVKMAEVVVAVAAILLVGLLLADLQGKGSPFPGVGAWLADLAGRDEPLSINESALLLAFAYLAGRIASLLLVGTWWLREHWIVGGWDADLARSYLRYALPVSLTTVMALILTYSSVTLLGYFWTSHEVGLYGVAQRGSALGMLAVVAVSTLLFPRFARLHADGDKGGTLRTLRQSERYLRLLSVPPAMALLALPKEILHVAVGDPYIGAAGALQGLGLAAMVAAASGPLTALLMAEGRLAAAVKASLINAALNLALTVVLLARASADSAPAAAAVACLVAAFAALVFLRVQVHRSHRVALIDASMLRIAVAGAVTWAAFRFGPMAVGIGLDRVFLLVPALAAGALLFLAVLALLGELGPEDMTMLRAVLHPGEHLREFRRG